MIKAQTVDEYFAALTPEQAKLLGDLRSLIRKAAPDAEECVSYGMPAFRLNGPLVYIGAFKNHCSLFPGNSSLVEKQFKTQLKGLITSKGTIQFPLGEPLPKKLIQDIVKTRVKDNLAKSKKR